MPYMVTTVDDEAETIESILILKDDEIKGEIDVIVDFIKTVCQNTSKKAVIGISGGIDSAVVSALAVQALGADNVIGIIMPYNEKSDSVSLGIKHCEKLGISYRYAPIGNQVDSLKEIFSTTDRLTFGNDMARMRMIFLYHFARDLNALVIGTDKLTEHMLGYFTKYGDGGVDINPIEHLYKAQVYQLAKELDILQEIIDRPPSA
jgi:NAD+ synthase